MQIAPVPEHAGKTQQQGQSKQRPVDCGHIQHRHQRGSDKSRDEQ